MGQQEPPAGSQEERSQGDPWHALGYIVSGVALYGVVGWLLDRWLGTEFLVAVGILFGAVLGIYLTFVRFNRTQQHDQQHDK
jgi:ATP synthase protein I